MTIGYKKPSFPKAKVGRKTGKQTKTTLTKAESAMISRRNGMIGAEIQVQSAYEESAPMVLPEQDLADLYADIYNPKAKIAPELKIQAAICYMLTGTVNGVERMTGISHQTVANWKNHSQWWGPVLAKIKKDKQEELDAEITLLIHKSTFELKDRLEHGDEVLVKEGERYKVHQRKLSGKDIASMINTLYDKRAMLRGDPTSISAKTSNSDILEELKSTFKQIADEAYNKKVISNVQHAEIIHEQ